MAIAVVFEFPNESVEKYDRALAEQPDLRTQPGRTHHICWETDGGWTVVDVWESEEAFTKFGEVLGPTLQRLELSTEPKVHPVHNTM
jgi:hypothetical protein